jgi:hypothetical protein
MSSVVYEFAALAAVAGLEQEEGLERKRTGY